MSGREVLNPYLSSMQMNFVEGLAYLAIWTIFIQCWGRCYLVDSSTMKRNTKRRVKSSLQPFFYHYCSPEEFDKETWVRSLFLINVDISVEDFIKERLHWYQIQGSIACVLLKLLVKWAMSILIPFATIHLYESGFSVLMSIKTKNCNWLDVKVEIRLGLAKTILQCTVRVQTTASFSWT